MAAAACLTGLALVAAPSNAYAASGCGRVCDYEDPASFKRYTGPYDWYYCADDAITARAYQAPGNPKIELRYSPRCRTAWARTPFQPSQIRVQSYNSDGSLRATAQATIVGSINWSAMLDDAGLTARACIAVSFSGWHCTSRY